MTLDEDLPQTRPGDRPRAIFSNQDFRLLRAALADYARSCENPADSRLAGQLLHRLGRAG